MGASDMSELMFSEKTSSLITIDPETGKLSSDVLPKIERKLLEAPQDFECPVLHHFGPGLYIRELRVPAGILGMGHTQKLTHMNNFVAGRVLMMNDDGTHTELCAPMTFVSPPGRKLVFVIEDMVWQNIYATDETDVEKLEATYLEKSAESLAFYGSNRTAEELDAIRADFMLAVSESGLTEEYVHEQTNLEDDQISMPFGWCKSCVLDSEIHGKGLFASAGFSAGEIIAPLVINGKRTPASRYTNHSPNPNAEGKVMPNGDIALFAIRDIAGCKSGGRGEEITTDYRVAIRYRKESLT